jgi:integrase
MATVLHERGTQDIVIQKILRHRNVQTTRAAYIKTEKQAVRAMNDFASSLPAVVHKWYKNSAEPEKPSIQ